MAESYDSLLADEGWRADMLDLNRHLIDSMTRAGIEPRFGGSPFYRHMQAQSLLDSKFTTRGEVKRRRLFDMARRGRVLIEVGVNGGHGLLFQKWANPGIRAIGIDICAAVGHGHPRADIYCPVAMDWLSARFPGEMEFHVGNSTDVLAQIAAERPDVRVDLVRLDGARSQYYSDFMAIRPLLHDESLIVFDDPTWPVVRSTIERLMAEGQIRPDDAFWPAGGFYSADPVMRLA